MKITKPYIFLALVIIIAACKNASSENKNEKPTVNTDAGNNIINNQPGFAGKGLDISPMDMVYYPVDYPKLKMVNKKIEAPVLRVIYSRPHLQGRRLFPDILKYDTIWRLGANESTEVEFFRNVTIDGHKVEKGRYIMYCIPHESTWTIALNKNIDSWGLRQDVKDDVLRVDVPVEKSEKSTEYFAIFMEPDTNGGASMLMEWDSLYAKLNIKY